MGSVCLISWGTGLLTWATATYITLGIVQVSRSCHSFFSRRFKIIEDRVNEINTEINNSIPQGITMSKEKYF